MPDKYLSCRSQLTRHDGFLLLIDEISSFIVQLLNVRFSEWMRVNGQGRKI